MGLVFTYMKTIKTTAIAHHGRFFSLAQFAFYAGTIINARREPSPVVVGWNEMTMAVDLTPELNLADLTNFAKDQWRFAFDQKGQEHSNKPYAYAVATIEKDLPKAFSAVLNDTLERAKHRELQKGRTSSSSGWDNYTGIGKGKGKSQGGKGSYQTIHVGKYTIYMIMIDIIYLSIIYYIYTYHIYIYMSAFPFPLPAMVMGHLYTYQGALRSRVGDRDVVQLSVTPVVLLASWLRRPKPRCRWDQWLFLVPLIGGRYHIITQLAIY